MADNIPRHIAVIPDGNRRWAKQRGLPAWEGHRRGAKTFNKLLKWCKELGVRELTFWCASTENLERDKKEVDFLLRLFSEMCDKMLKDENNELRKHEVKITFIGDLDRLPEDLSKKMRLIMKQTKNHSAYKLNLLVGYGGRWEITEAAKRIANKVKQGKLRVDDITPETFHKHLVLQDEPDLVIRTSEERLSGFLPWQCVYSEIIFLKEKHWPDFTKQDLEKCINDFSKRQRRYGK